MPLATQMHGFNRLTHSEVTQVLTRSPHVSHRHIEMVGRGIGERIPSYLPTKVHNGESLRPRHDEI